MTYFEQFKKLLLETPKHHLPMQDCENCDYNSFLYSCKTCYMCFGSNYLEDSLYIDESHRCKTSADLNQCEKCELCYESIDCLNCYSCDYCQDCKNSNDCFLCYDCSGCRNCFGCVGLRRQEYMIFNEKVSQEEYEGKIEELKKNPEAAVVKFQELQKTIPRLFMHGVGNEECTGDYINNCKNCYMTFGSSECEDCLYVMDDMYEDKDCLHCTHIHNCELCYECVSADKSYNINLSFWVTDSSNCEYCYCVQSCHDCFMCTYTQRKKFHILNEPYSEEEYHKKVAEIKAELREQKLLGENLLYLALYE